jgi:hypothetical protein
LGYSSLAVFRDIGAAGAFFLTRWSHKIALFLPDGRRFDLLKHLRKYGSFDGQVLAGAQEKLPVRLVATPVTERVAAERRRKLLHSRDKRLNPDQTHLALLGWSIFLTNVSPQVWDTWTVGLAYVVRWRIEIIFKSWKTHFKIHAFDHPTPTEVEALLSARLVHITLFHADFFNPLCDLVYAPAERHLSLLKTSDLFRIWRLLKIDIDEELLLQQAQQHCLYEKRKKRTNHGQFMKSLEVRSCPCAALA